MIPESGTLFGFKSGTLPFMTNVLRVVLLAICSAFMGISANAAPATAQDLALIAAARRGDLGVVEELIRAGASVQARDGDGRTALLVATEADRIPVARALIAAGADVNAKDEMEDSPFLYAGAEGRNAILKMTLAAGADLKSVNRYGGTALIPAAHHGHIEAVRILLGTKIDKDHVNKLGWTALLEAVILGDGGPVHTEIVQLLVQAGANVNVADRDGVTPLQHATQRGFVEMVRILTSHGAK
jgi:ankyrin repeat protein